MIINLCVCTFFIFAFVEAKPKYCQRATFANGQRHLLAEERQRVTFSSDDLDCMLKLRVLLVGGGGDGAAFGGNGGGSGYVVYDEV